MTPEEISSEIRKMRDDKRLAFTAEEFGKAYTAVFVDTFRRIPVLRKSFKGEEWAFWIGHVVQFLPPCFIIGAVVILLRD